MFCYPNGTLQDFNSDTIEITKRHRFHAACSTLFGYVGVDNNTDLFKMPRVPIPNSLYHFIQDVSGLEILKNKLRK